MCTVGRDQFPRSIKLTSSLLLLLLMFNTAVTAMGGAGAQSFDATPGGGDASTLASPGMLVGRRATWKPGMSAGSQMPNAGGGILRA